MDGLAALRRLLQPADDHAEAVHVRVGPERGVARHPAQHLADVAGVHRRRAPLEVEGGELGRRVLLDEDAQREITGVAREVLRLEEADGVVRHDEPGQAVVDAEVQLAEGVRVFPGEAAGLLGRVLVGRQEVALGRRGEGASRESDGQGRHDEPIAQGSPPGAR